MKYEVQLKGLLDKATYDHLLQTIPQQFPRQLSGTLQQTRYRSAQEGSGDVRLRRWYREDGSIDGAECILKEDTADGVAAKQRTERKQFLSIEELALFEHAFSILKVYHDPPWTKYKTDFSAGLNHNQYRLSLQKLWGQYTEFGYVLEGSIKLNERDDGTHLQNLHTLFETIGVKATLPNEFMKRVHEFIRENTPSDSRDVICEPTAISSELRQP